MVAKGPRINDQIRVPKVRVVGPEGEMLGVITVAEGIEIARRAGMDLVEVSPNAEPPVCKVLDYGKFKYTQQKKANEAKKKQKIIQIKEVKVRPTIDKHDLDVKMKHIHKFLEAGDKVKLTLRFRGREMAHQELGLKLLNEIREALGDVIKVEHHPKLEGRQMIMVVAPAQQK
jgi:translation initiation factor IF-3